MLKPDEITAGGDSAALRVIAYAVAVAPCLDHLPAEGDLRDRAVAVLSGVMQQIQARGSASLRGQRVGSAAADYAVGSFFTADDRLALASICSAINSNGIAGLSKGEFPGTRLLAVWPGGGNEI